MLIKFVEFIGDKSITTVTVNDLDMEEIRIFRCVQRTVFKKPISCSFMGVNYLGRHPCVNLQTFC